MIIGHLPVGYITSKLIFPRFSSRCISINAFILAGILGALAPDLDMLYFHLVDHRQHHHHTYWTHYPIVWGILLLISLVLLKTMRLSNRPVFMFIFSLNGLIHMFIDTIVGDIWWFAPFIDKPFALFTVPALYKPWWLNFILHWSFVLEIVACIWAVILWRFKRVQL
ncbi:MAG: metal-dependent hydrolase [Pseudomonadota bacterium]